MRQRLGYGAADMASNLIWPMICTYLTVYYTDALLLDTAAVGVITLASKFIDAITDVLMGIIVDKTEFKSGKCRPYFVIGALPLALFAVLAFLLPSFVSNNKVLIILFAFITFNLVSTCYTIVNTPLSAILPSLSADQKERNVLVYSGACNLTKYGCRSAHNSVLLQDYGQKEVGYPYELHRPCRKCNLYLLRR